MNQVHFSSATDDWATPQDFFDKLNAEFRFTLDVCASEGNAKCERYFTAQDDGLSKPWDGICWMNPPYGRGIGDWMRKAYESARCGATVAPDEQIIRPSNGSRLVARHASAFASST